MLSKWVSTHLDDVCEKITDGAHASPKSVNDGLPMASVKDLTSFGINLDSCRLISKEDFQKLVRQGCQPKPGDVLIAKDGNSALDTVCEIKDKMEVVLLSSVAILRPNPGKIISPYLRYHLDCETTRQYLKGGFITGAAIPRVILKDFKRSKISLPPLPTQSKIASILSTYDDLIENNTRRIEILEGVARMIYQEWFVKFRFPGHGNIKMIDSKLGNIPEGWTAEKLGDVIELAYGKGLRAADRIPGPFPVFGSGGIVGSHNKSLVDGPGIIVGRKGNVGSVFWSEDSFFPIDTVFYVVTDLSLTYVYYNLQNQNFINSDAAVPGLSRKQAYGNLFLKPSTEIMADFEQQIQPVFDQIRILESQNNNLRTTRDLLLPKLISGEVDVSELDIAIPEEAAA
jgi:type I restriction enzyme, S subunit